MIGFLSMSTKPPWARIPWYYRPVCSRRVLSPQHYEWFWHCPRLTGGPWYGMVVACEKLGRDPSGFIAIVVDDDDGGRGVCIRSI